MGYTEKIVVIGAGISGLACSYCLKQLGIPCLVLEADGRAGGVIGTIRRNGFVFEAGPQCPRFPRSIWRLVQELDLETEFVPGDPKAKRYIARHGRLHRAPFSPVELLTTRLVGLSSKWRILAEVFGSTRPPHREESLADFVQRKFGTEVLDYLVDPFISTIFFGDAHKMGMQSAFPSLVEWERNQGSLVRGAIRASKSKRRAPAQENPSPRGLTTKRNALHVTDELPSLGSFRSGMDTLPNRLAEELREEIRYSAAITSLASSASANGMPPRGWNVVLTNGEKIVAQHVVLAVPAYVAANLLANFAPQLACQLSSIEYAPMCAVASAYNRSKVANALDGFGFMVPRREGLQTLCTFWNSSLFPQRAPKDKVVITSFAGRAMAGDSGSVCDEQFARIVDAENASFLGITDRPVDRVVWRNPRALPQYNLGHAQRVAEIDRLLQSIPNLSIVGNFLKGRSMGDCVEIAFNVAEGIHSRICGNNH